LATDYKIENLYQGSYSTLDPDKAYAGGFTGYRTNPGDLSITTDPRTANVLKEITTKLSGGLKNVELVLLSPTMDMVPKQHLKEVGQLSKLTGVDMTVHGPVIDVAGMSQQGFDEFSRQQSERVIINTLERSQEVNPEGNINVTFHTSEGIPGGEWKSLGDVSGKNKREYNKMIVVDRTTGQMITQLSPEKRYLPEAEKGVREDTETPEERLIAVNKTRWDDEVNKVIFQKEMGDRIISELPPSAKELYVVAKHDQEFFSKLPREQQQVLLNARIADEHLLDAQQAIYSLFSKAYEHTDKNTEKDRQTRKLLEQAGRNFQKNLTGFDKDEEKLSKEEMQIAYANQMDLQNRSRALQLFAQEIKNANPNYFVPLEDFALEKTAMTFGNAAYAAYKKFKDKAPVISIENPPVGHALSTGEDLKNVVQESRKKFVQNLIENEKMNEKQAEKIAEKLIGATWDVGHINMLRKQGFGKEEIVKESEKIRPFLKHVHLSDNFGMEHTELPMGMGNVPMKEIMDKLGKEGFEAKKVIEASSWWQHFQTNPAVETLEGLGAPIYGNRKTPYWNQALGFYQGYQSGLEGAWLPGNNYQLFGTYFSQLPTELGGQAPNAQGSRMSGRGME
jgi:hypothetical protein